MYIPTKVNNTIMTPTEFEKLSLSLFESAIKDIVNAEVTHNEIIKVSDGSYQIDGTIRFEIMGIKYLTLVECKMYKNAISREKVQVLYDKLRATGAQKGILVTTASFQSGAIDYAKSHGIALVQILDGKLRYEVRSYNLDRADIPEWVPKYTAIALEKIKKNTIRCVDVLETNYLSSFLINKNGN